MKRILLAVSLIPLLLVLPVLFISKAQTDDPDLLLYDGYPDVYPIQFQALAPGETPRQSNFTSRLPLQFNSDAAIIYVILQNTGWSQGFIGFGSDVFDFEKEYVGLEVEPGEDGLYTPLENGLAFQLNHAEDDFHLPILISQRHIFAVYQIVETGGTTFSGYTNIAARHGVTTSPVEYLIDPKPVLGAFVLDCHIVARVLTPTPVPATPIPTTAYQPDTNSGPVEPPHPVSTAIPPGITLTPPTLINVSFTPSNTPPPPPTRGTNTVTPPA
jgi:hypothetical protein